MSGAGRGSGREIKFKKKRRGKAGGVMERKRGRRRGDRVGWKAEGGNGEGGGGKRERERVRQRERERKNDIL